MDEKKQAKAGAGSWPSRPPSAAVSLYGNEIGLFMRFDYCAKSPQGHTPLSANAQRYLPPETIVAAAAAAIKRCCSQFSLLLLFLLPS